MTLLASLELFHLFCIFIILHGFNALLRAQQPGRHVRYILQPLIMALFGPRLLYQPFISSRLFARKFTESNYC